MDRLMRFGGVLCAVALLGACDIPTELPKWDTTFIVKSDSTTLSVQQILPGPSVTLTSGGSAFALNLSPSTISQSLGTLCPACAALNGQTAPKPAFNASFSTTISLPSDVTGAALTSGSVNLSIRNGFSFDPLRPSASARGSMTIAITSGATTIGSTTVSGNTQALPAGGLLAVTVPLTAATINGPLTVTVTIDSPAGDATTIDSNAQLTVTATPTNLVISSATVRVQNRQVTASQVQLDVGDIDSAITDHIQGGALLLTINNPFAVAGTFTLTITGGTQPISKQFAVGSGVSEHEVPFTANELQSFIGLGHPVTLSLTGLVSATSAIVVTPAQKVTVATRLKLIIGPRD